MPNPEAPVKEYSVAHQPLVICVDTSGSMGRKTEDGIRTKADIVQEMINDLVNIPISEIDKAAIDILILGFDDCVQVIQDWIPLSDFNGNVSLTLGNCTALGSAIVESIQATRERRRVYDQLGILSRRAQIFLYTDGVSTEDMSAAYQRSAEYLNREAPSAKLYTILIPPATDPSELKGLGSKVAILAAKNCVNGIPQTFKFLQDSVVAWSASSPGKEVEVKIEGDDLAYIDKQGGIETTDEGATSYDGDVWSHVRR